MSCNRKSLAFCSLLALTISSCMVRKPSTSSKIKAFDLPTNFNFQEECGVSQADAANPDFEIFSDNYRSLPIRISGTSTGISFRVVTTADVAIKSSTGETQQQISVKVNEAVPTTNSYLAQMLASKLKQKADAGAAANSGFFFARSIPIADWVQMNGDGSQAFPGVICGAIGTSQIRIAKGKQNASISFSPGIIFNLNPKASLERLKQEFASERTAQITASATGTSPEIVKGTHMGTQTIRPIDPSIEIEGTVIQADAAWEVLFWFPKGAYSVGLPSRQAYYLDSKNKTFSLIVTQSDQRDESTGGMLPPAYLLRVAE